jgi:hypothetical protein
MMNDSRSSFTTTYTDSAPLMNMQSEVALDVWSGLGDHCSPQRSEAMGYGLSNTGERLSPRLVGKAELIALAKILWAAPWSLWGMLIGVLGLLTGGGVQRSGRLVEFWGGFLPLFLRYFPFIAGSPVATFGHVVVGRSKRHLDACRPHQLIHVAQYERWGLLFVPAYLTWWGVLWCCGKRPYYDNPFEREAFEQTV